MSEPTRSRASRFKLLQLPCYRFNTISCSPPNTPFCVVEFARYAPFCKHLFVPCFLPDAVVEAVPITPENQHHLRSDYEVWKASGNFRTRNASCCTVCGSTRSSLESRSSCSGAPSQLYLSMPSLRSDVTMRQRTQARKPEELPVLVRWFPKVRRSGRSGQEDGGARGARGADGRRGEHPGSARSGAPPVAGRARPGRRDRWPRPAGGGPSPPVCGIPAGGGGGMGGEGGSAAVEATGRAGRGCRPCTAEGGEQATLGERKEGRRRGGRARRRRRLEGRGLQPQEVERDDGRRRERARWGRNPAGAGAGAEGHF